MDEEDEKMEEEGDLCFYVSFHVTSEIQDALLMMTFVSDTNTQKILMSLKK